MDGGDCELGGGVSTPIDGMRGIADYLLENWPQIAGVLAVIGTAIAWLSAKAKEWRKEQREQRAGQREADLSYTEILEDRLKRQELRLKEKDADVARVTEENIQLRVAATKGKTPPADVLRTIIRSDELGLSWAKKRITDFDFIMVAVSPAYARQFLGGPPEIYEGRRDREIWPEDIAAAFIANDEEVFKTQTGLSVRERVEGSRTNAAGWFVGRKFSVRLADGCDYLVGIGDLYTDDDETPAQIRKDGWIGAQSHKPPLLK